ncbi:hypothetical protein Fmac_005824 [Flemingia macrophylla]|uniref:Cytochrome b5 heme-binding domain-containing protein n=1 Tax=Flemingia macrophylla TaxID=520843 RepID=A0ABD1N8X6_9FABA
MGNLLPSSTPSKTQGLLTHASPHHASPHPPTAATAAKSTNPTTTSTEEAASRDAAASYISSSHLRNDSMRHADWISIDGAIYDVTEWLHRHPGGSLPLRLRDPAVSPASSDYPPPLSELSGAGLFERKGHTTVAFLSVILALLVLSVAGVVLSDRSSVHALSGALVGLACIHPPEL